MAEKTGGYQINGRFYPFAQSFRLGDPVLVEELTGLEWDRFLERLPDDETPDDQVVDPVASLGLIGVAVSQANPTWRRDRVVRFVGGLRMEDVQAIAPDVDEEATDGPPETTEAGSSSSEPTASDSAADSDSPSEQ